MSGNRFQGRSAIVTGAASGIGRGIAARLAAEGAVLGLMDINGEALAAVAEELRARGATVHTAVADVTDQPATAAAVETLAGAAGGLDVLVAAAGYGHVRPALDMEPAEWTRMVDVMVNGTFWSAQAAARLMVRQGRGGSIVFIASINSFMPGKGNPHYSAAKAGVANLAKAMGFELGEHGIRVNAIGPGVIRTPLAAGLIGNEQYAKHYVDMTPLGRFGEPEDVAAAAAFLASDDAAYITGHLLVVDGGITAGIDFIPQD